MRSIVVVAAFCVASCATEPTVRWGDETPVETVKSDKTEAAKPKTAAEYAARFPTDGECEAEARRIDAKNRDLALKLLAVCIDRGDFKRLNALVDAPWTNTLKSLPDANVWCARVVAARAGDVENDVKACAKAGLAVRTLEQLFAEPDKAKGTIVIFRARIDVEHTGKGVKLVETSVEDGEVETQPTGRRISATLGTNKLPGRDAILLGRASKMAEDASADDGEPMAVVDVLGSYAAADRPTFN
jgi:hypothetical protein